MNVVERNLSLVSFIIRLIWRNEEAAPAVYQKNQIIRNLYFYFSTKRKFARPQQNIREGFRNFLSLRFDDPNSSD